MKKTLFGIFGLAIIASLVFTGCDDDPIIPPVPEVIENLELGIMNGELPENYTLDATVQYNLTGSFIVPAGVTLTIPAGTNILA
ncbi:MAG: hypothetical protein V2I31_14795, partial [Mariniphaga sp.]|nr:hypothetical protein [Mariniphaga sp.]